MKNHHLRNAKTYACILALAASAAAQARTIGVDLVSDHIPAHADQNNVNPGVYALLDNGVGLGTYRNTLRRESFWLGYHFETGPVTWIAGLISGYQRRETAVACAPGFTGCTHISGNSRGYLMPFLSPSIALPEIAGATPRISFVPGVGNSSSVFHLSVEWRLQ